MRYIFKLLMLPVVVVFCVMKLFLEGAAKLYCLVVGIVINLLAVCSVLAIITQQWFALILFGILFVIILSVFLCAGMITVLLDNIKDKLQRV